MAHSKCGRCVDPMTNKKGRCVFVNETPSKAYKVKGTGKGRNAASDPVPKTETMSGIPDEHGRGDIPERERAKKVRKVRRKGHG